jgi:hypothetical protein
MNAKDELLRELIGMPDILCASISHNNYRKSIPVVLKVSYSIDEYERFLKELDFEYDSGYGGQELFGTVWLADGTWITRGEYDGSEWWEHNELPQIPIECQRNQ